ncbi:MAG: class III signal peptide-containing protein [Candidatus Diapherotrites archaeon]|jgi:hypothetical protein|uniref:Class III signal peptide-containing protein n=1 Tax=Candidatus Iainarchaeum sp. TaxID=3101447 RepID=A0A8T5GGE3_9ARCH|nr:class III signal peptide-containing protein [Candidatus Diapherotrites archaeon]MBT7240894.1 class III signal peptide-containing protein [Candidatus Diapherotrites archaeon]
MNFNKKGQGAIEYLLLLAAAIVVVAIVISFLSSTIAPVQDQGNKQLFDSLCTGPLSGDGNSLLCGCYTKNPELGDLNSQRKYNAAGEKTCPERLDAKYHDDPLLDWTP